jgi:hypothetical protein
MEQIPGFMVYWMHQPHGADCMQPSARHFEMNEMSLALKFMDALRNEGLAQFVTMVSQNANSVGKAGATGVKDGRLPTGEDYTYGKGDALSQRTKVYVPVSTDNVEVKLDDE